METNLSHTLCLELLGLRIGLGIIEQIEICTEMRICAQGRAEFVQADEWIGEKLSGTIIIISGGGSSSSRSSLGGRGRGSGGGSYKT